MISWQDHDPLPPWTDRRRCDRRGHGRPTEGISVTEWIVFAVSAFALVGLIASAALHLG